MIYIQNFNYGIQTNIWLTEMYNNHATFSNVLAAWYTHICPALVIVIIPQLQQIWKGVSCFHLARLSVCVSVHPSVCLWTDACPLCIFNNICPIYFMFTRLVKQLQTMCHI